MAGALALIPATQAIRELIAPSIEMMRLAFR